MNNDVFEIEIDENELKNIAHKIMMIGIKDKIHPGKFLIALLHASKSICSYENIDLKQLVKLITHDEDPHLH